MFALLRSDLNQRSGSTRNTFAQKKINFDKTISKSHSALIENQCKPKVVNISN